MIYLSFVFFHAFAISSICFLTLSVRRDFPLAGSSFAVGFSSGAVSATGAVFFLPFFFGASSVGVTSATGADFFLPLFLGAGAALAAGVTSAVFTGNLAMSSSMSLISFSYFATLISTSGFSFANSIISLADCMAARRGSCSNRSLYSYLSFLLFSISSAIRLSTSLKSFLLANDSSKSLFSFSAFFNSLIAASVSSALERFLLASTTLFPSSYKILSSSS